MEYASKFVSHQTTGYIDLLSLAQQPLAGHQECKLAIRGVFMFSRIGLSQLRKTRTRHLAVFAGWISHVGPDFHGFLCNALFAMWIWLEAQSVLPDPSFFSHTHQIPSPILHSLCTIN